MRSNSDKVKKAADLMAEAMMRSCADGDGFDAASG
jgi:hypothetical protein